MSSDVLIAICACVAVPVGLVLYTLAIEALLGRFGSRKAQGRVRAALWLLPGGLLMATVLGYPVVSTLVQSFGNASGEGFMGFANYIWAFGDPTQQAVIGRTLLWMLAVPTLTVVVGLVFSVLADRVRYERLARLCITIPCAVSMTAGSIIWSLMYAYAPPGAPQNGLVNAVYTSASGQDPVPWLLDESANNPALMMIGLWAWLGFAGLLLSGAIKAVPTEYLQAARMDGANEWKVFRYVTLPHIVPMLVVVFTMIVAWALKVFDIVYVLTGGQYSTGVLGTSVYDQLFTVQNAGRGSALAVVILVLALPVVFVNVWRVRKEERV